MPEHVTIIDAKTCHAGVIAAIYNQALGERLSTFETEPRTADDMAEWLSGEIAVKLAVIDGKVAGFAKVSNYRDRACYTGIREYSVYVDRAFQRRGIGRKLMQELISTCRQAGLWKLLSRIFPENVGSIELAKSVGFRVVGTYYNHGQLDGVWKDCVIVELSL